MLLLDCLAACYVLKSRFSLEIDHRIPTRIAVMALVEPENTLDSGSDQKEPQ
jgi:hypothetical protein